MQTTNNLRATKSAFLLKLNPVLEKAHPLSHALKSTTCVIYQMF